MDKRKAEVKRTTKETDVNVELVIDGQGISEISTGIGFLDHMLGLLARHGFMDLKISARGDTHVDYHHTTEDVGICLGQAVAKACGNKRGIKRFGNATVPMGRSLVTVSLDLCDRPTLVYNVAMNKGKVGDFDVELVEEFMLAFANHSGATLHINMSYGDNNHHVIEAIFKALGIALDQATTIDERIQGVLSTKGVL